MLKISSRILAKISKGEKLADRVMSKLCSYFSCSKDDLCRVTSANPILQILREEKEHKILGDLYHELQIIIDFHYRFERIHPFRDRNGSIEKLIAFKECLKNNLVPFIIEERKKIITTVVLKNTTMNRASLLILATRAGHFPCPGSAFRY